MSTHNTCTLFSIKKKTTLNYHISAAMRFFQGAQERVRNSRGKRASVFESLKFYCILPNTQLNEGLIELGFNVPPTTRSYEDRTSI